MTSAYELRLEGPAKNALGEAMMTRIESGLREARGRPLLLTGGGDAFCAGLNLKDVAALDGPGMGRFLRRLEDLMSALFQHSAPSVALVNGHAIAGGSILALCCDWSVAPRGSSLKMGLNEVALGLRFPPRILEICRRRLPHRYLGEVLLGSRLYDAVDAARVGLLDEVSERAEEAAHERLAALAAHPAAAYAATKADLRGARPADLVGDAAWAERMEELMPAWTDPALQTRIAAVLRR